MERFGISAQLDQILWNTARHFGWLDNQRTPKEQS